MGRLALSRKRNESVIVGLDDTNLLKVYVASVTAGKVKLVFEAPNHIPIFREEIWNKRQQKS